MNGTDSLVTLAPTIAPMTQARLAHPAASGQRHAQIVQIAAALIGQGFNAEAVFWQIRPNYGPDVSDTEIRSVIAWAVSRIAVNGTEKTKSPRFPNRYHDYANYGKRPFSSRFPFSPKPPHLPQSPVSDTAFTTPKTPVYRNPFPQNTVTLPVNAFVSAAGIATANRSISTSVPASTPETDPVTAIERFLGGFRCEEYDLWECSQIRPADNWGTDAVTVIAALFRSGENVNIVSRFAVNDGKARPHGYGITQNRETWFAEIARNGPPKSASGVWIRPNPTDGNGISDANVTAYRFLLVEFDAIPLPLQIAFIARLPLPIAAVITSGGKSVHAWIAVNAENATEYRTIAARIFAALAPFGVDTANKNPARLSRLPGVIREIGTVTGTDNRQRLLYLNPEPKAERIIA